MTIGMFYIHFHLGAAGFHNLLYLMLDEVVVIFMKEIEHFHLLDLLSGIAQFIFKVLIPFYVVLLIINHIKYARHAFNSAVNKLFFMLQVPAGFYQLGNIILDAQIVGNIAGFVFHRVDVDAIPEHAAVVAVITQLEPAATPSINGFTHLIDGFLVAVVGLLIAVAIVMTIVARRTRFGRYIFATGGNPDAAELSGINTRLLTVKVFALMGFLCALSAVVASARLTFHANDIGTLDELRVIAAAVIGGTALSGGIGTIYGAILGALIMQSLQSGMAMVGVDAPFQNIVVGSVLVLAVLIDIIYRKRLGEK